MKHCDMNSLSSVTLDLASAPMLRETIKITLTYVATWDDALVNVSQWDDALANNDRQRAQRG